MFNLPRPDEETNLLVPLVVEIGNKVDADKVTVPPDEVDELLTGKPVTVIVEKDGGFKQVDLVLVDGKVEIIE